MSDKQDKKPTKVERETYPVSRSAMIPAPLIDENGVPQHSDWPRMTSQIVKGKASDGGTVIIGSTSVQDAESIAPRVTGSSIAYEARKGDVRYSVDLNPDGSISGTGKAAGISMDPVAVANLAKYYDALTDHSRVSGAQLNDALQAVRKLGGIER